MSFNFYKSHFFTYFTFSVFSLQFCVHADKRKMLQELTRDIHHHANKAQVLNELAGCVASGTFYMHTPVCTVYCTVLHSLAEILSWFFTRSLFLLVRITGCNCRMCDVSG